MIHQMIPHTDTTQNEASSYEYNNPDVEMECDMVIEASFRENNVGSNENGGDGVGGSVMGENDGERGHNRGRTEIRMIMVSSQYQYCRKRHGAA